MKAITLWQPWASLVAIGGKRIETRSWPTSYRGPLAIHAGVRWQWDSQLEMVVDDPFKSALNNAGYNRIGRLPKGAVLAVAHLVWVGPIYQREDGEIIVDGVEEPISEDEFAFGDYRRGRFGWVLEEVRCLVVPIPCRGYQGLWDLPPEILAKMQQVGFLP